MSLVWRTLALEGGEGNVHSHWETSFHPGWGGPLLATAAPRTVQRPQSLSICTRAPHQHILTSEMDI